MKITIGNPAPSFELMATNEKKLSLSDLKGHPVVLYFYPKDCTSGCIKEGEGFKDFYSEFQALGAIILGVSKDSLASHQKFKADHSFPFELLSDPDGAVCKQYGVLKSRMLLSSFMFGIERSTFLIDADGLLSREWRKVDVEGHALEVLEAVRALKA